MDKFDFFFSHHSDSTKNLVEKTASILDSMGIHGWYAERDIIGAQNYTEKIPEAIRECRLFVLLINKYANASRHVMREVNIAMSNSKPILFIALDDCVLSDAIAYASSVSQIIKIHEKNTSVTAQRISEEICNWFNRNSGDDAIIPTPTREGYKTSWEGNDLEFFGDEGERNRIDQQHKFIYDFAHEVYEEVLSDAHNATFLDIGCHTAEQSMMFLQGRDGIRYIGIDREEKAIEQGKTLYPEAKFYHSDCESEDFDDLLCDIEEELSIDGFDFINLSLLLLHTKNPRLLLDTLSSHLLPGGRFIILDIDDGFNIAYPDPDGKFQKAVDTCFETAYSGFRHCGRTIYKFLNDIDLRNVRLHKIGLSTVGMDRREKESFFDIYFWFILDDLRKMHSDAPNNQFIKNDLDWIESNYKEMKIDFKKKDFFFNLGFVIFTAEWE